MTAAKPAGRTKQAVKHGTKKGFEASTLLAAGGGILISTGALTTTQWQDGLEAINTGNWIGLALVALAAAVRLAPAALRSLGYTRTADAAQEAQSPDSPGGKDFTVGEIVGIGQAALKDVDTGMRERSGDQSGEDES